MVTAGEGGLHLRPMPRRLVNESSGHCWPRLLQTYITAARRHGARAHSVVSWVRRKLGADLVVIRQRSDGTFGSSVPCVYCLRELTRFDLRVHCTLDGGGVFSGRLTDSGAPKSTLTTGQRRMLGKD
ncbi:hypothetical protein N2152v2_007766 [Parachlorella kessleri]